MPLESSEPGHRAHPSTTAGLSGKAGVSQVGRCAVLIQGDGGRVSASEKGGGGRCPWRDQFRTYLLNASIGACIQLQNVKVMGTRLPGLGVG